ncbi:glycosyltransferase family 2 protein [Thomasclavelia cocleata]|jgi:glycosyltransferase involved in cell wall biosynthesis|uniref:glycosyltransferase family 2 protein n=1 Tax=Thomasclavelia cocleata TaxID=69824 RepID=UPI00272E7ECF|nr:glycosyltransferase family 2 protein [Thomasclavelia cocleata]
MKKYKLSIIIPAYNTAQNLNRTLNVLECQSAKDFEIIIVNDNSQDDTEKIIFNFQKDFPNIKYFKNNTNNGPGYSRNIGIENISGEFITFLDSDDWPDLTTYETAINTLDENINCDFVIWGIKNEYNNKFSSYIRTDYKTYNTLNKELAISMLCNTYSLDISISSYLGNKMFKSNFIKKNNILFDEIFFEDVVFSFKTILYSDKIILLPNIYTHYYQRTDSITHSFSQKHIYDMFEAFNIIKNIINNDNCVKYKNDFASLIEKCSKTLFKLIYNNIDNSIEQKEFLNIYFKKLLDFCGINNILNYIDSERLKRILIEF